jgi:hypothetical protein
MAEDLASEILPAPRVAEPVGVFRKRFAIAYLALAAIAGACIGAMVLLVDRPSDDVGAVWSSWRPEGSESTFDSQIADYVGARYRLPSGNPIAAVIPGPPTITVGGADLEVRNVVIQDDPQGDADGYRVVSVGDSRMYQLCGGGEQCSIGEGAPSEPRMRLLRREALELALYTFKYTEGTDTVITLLPPNLGRPDDPEDDAAVALFFEKSALRKELDQPLRRTLLSANPAQAVQLNTFERLLIERLTGNRLFLYQFRPDLAGGAMMFLARPR